MGWIDHNGSRYPKHAKLSDPVLVRFRDGEETHVAEPVRHWAGPASNWSWDRRHPSPSEIVAYRVVPRNIGSIAHIDHGKTSLTAAITKVLAAQKENGNEQT